VEPFENIDENFVNHQEAAGHADRIAAPIEVKESGITVPDVGWEDHAEGQNLRNDIGEEELERAKQAATKHQGQHPELQQGMHDPERVIHQLHSLAHASVSPGAVIQMPGKIAQCPTEASAHRAITLPL
jgi:hypothetical protein